MMPTNKQEISNRVPSLEKDAEMVLRRILLEKSAPGDANLLVKICHTLALPYIKRRLARDKILKETFGLNIADFTYDCIADLFATGNTNQLQQFHAYFAAYNIDILTSSEIISHLRRLVFSQANEGIFRLYNEADPALGKVIRNIKLAIQQFQIFKLILRFGEPCLVPSEGDANIQLRSIETEELERGLSQYLHGNENIPYMLGKLQYFLQEQTDVSRVVPLSMAANTFRSVYINATRTKEIIHSPDSETTNDDLKRAITIAIQKLKPAMVSNYAKKKNIKAELIETYFKVIEKKLTLTFEGDGEENGLYDLLREHIVDLNKQEYQSTHQNRLEYLSRLTGNETAKILDINF